MSPTIFISYSSSDRNEATALHTRLTAAEMQVWRDETRLETDWSREIAQGLIESDALCLLWSEAASQSLWVRNEWLTARALEKLIVPCLLDGAPALPPPLRSLQCVVLRDLGPCLDSLSRRLKGTEPSSVRYDYSITPPTVYVPFNPNPNFIGREDQIVGLYRTLIGNIDKVGASHVGLVGLGGVGKTQLAVELAYRFAFAFTAVYWIEAADSERWSDLLVEIARDRLGLQVDEPRGPESSRRYLFALQKHFRGNPGQLLVMDNVVDPFHLNDDRFLFGWSPLNLGCSVLYTTRRYAELPGVINLPLEPLATEDARRLLTTGREPASSAESDDATTIAEALGNLPLALVLAGAYLQKYEDVSFHTYMSELLPARLDAIEIDRSSSQSLATRHREAVRTTLASQWAALTNENARELLLIASAFPEAAVIPKARLRLLFGARGRTGLERPFERALHSLRELILVEDVTRGLSAVRLHPLVREFVRATVSDEERSACCVSAADRLRLAYELPARLDLEYAERGLDAIVGDLAFAAQWKHSPEVDGLLQAIERDLHVLRKEGGADALCDFLPQLHFRSHIMGQAIRAMSLAEECGRRGSFLRFYASSQRDDPAWIRSLPGSVPFSFSRDGFRALAMTGDTLLVFLDTTNGKTLRILDGHSAPVRAVSISGEGGRALSGSASGELILWDLGSGQALRRMQAGHACVTCVGVDDTGRRGVSACDDGTLVTWELEQGAAVRRIHLQGYATCLSVSGESERVLVGTLDSTVLLWELTGLREPHRLGLHEDFIFSVAITPDGRFGVSCTKYERTIRVWDIEQRELCCVCNDIEQSRSDIWLDCAASVSISASGDLVAGGMGDGTLRLWELPTGQLRRVLRGHADEVSQVSLNAQGTRVLAGHQGGEHLILWDTTRAESFTTPIGHTGDVWAVCLSDDAAYGLSGAQDHGLVLWDAPAGAPLRRLELEGHWIESVAFVRDGRSALTTSSHPGALEHGCLTLWDLESGEIQNQAGRSLGAGGHRIVRSLPGGRYALTCRHDELVVWDLVKWREVRCWSASDHIHEICPSRDGRNALTTASDGWMTVWDLESTAAVARLEIQSKNLWGAAWSADGQRALAFTSDGGAVFWEPGTGASHVLAQGSGDELDSFNGAMSQDGRWGITVRENGFVVLWDLERREIAARVSIPGAYRVAIARRTVMFGGAGGGVHFGEISETTGDTSEAAPRAVQLR